MRDVRSLFLSAVLVGATRHLVGSVMDVIHTYAILKDYLVLTSVDIEVSIDN